MAFTNTDDKYGRQSKVDNIRTTVMTVSGTAVVAGGSIMGRRNYISVKNIGTVDVAVVNDAAEVAANGYIVDANGGEWSDNTDAVIYIISTGAASEVRVYERASRFSK